MLLSPDAGNIFSEDNLFILGNILQMFPCLFIIRKIKIAIIGKWFN